MECKAILIVFALVLGANSGASTGKKFSNSTPPKFECKMSKSMNQEKALKLTPQKGLLQFEIPYSTSDCKAQSYELKAKKDSLIIIEYAKMESCMRHSIGYFLVGKIENLKKGYYYINVVRISGDGARYELINGPVKIEIP